MIVMGVREGSFFPERMRIMKEDAFSKKDYELISGYMDQELSDAEILSFAERLSEGDGLEKELAELMKVKSIVKEIPEVPAPRNYFLTRSMAEDVRKPGLLERLFPFFRVSAALCALLLVLTFIFPQVLGINPRSDYAVMSQDAAFEAEETSGDQRITVPGSAFGGSAQPVSMPSRGTIGGNPQNQYRISSGLENHPDRMDVIWPESYVFEDSEMGSPDGNEGSVSSGQGQQDTAEKFALSDLLKILFGSLFGISVVCVAIVLRRRAKLHLPDAVEKIK